MRLAAIQLLGVLFGCCPALAAEIRLLDLKPFYNFSLTNSPIATGGTNGPNNLSTFPAGKGTYGDVPFEVSGIVQLTSNQAVLAKRKFPEKIEGIKVGAACARVHLLHGAGWNDVEKNTIGVIVLRYTDGSASSIPIVYGRHVYDWWVNDEAVEDPNTKIAWTGVNKVSKMFGTDLRIYRTTFANPKPTAVVDSIDFASTKKESAPFLLGLSVE